MRKLTLFLILLLGSFGYLIGQIAATQLVPDEIIVWLQEDVDVNEWLQTTQARQAAAAAALQFEKKLGIRHNFHLLKFDAEKQTADVWLNWLAQQREVKVAQQNSHVTFRQWPNDALVDQQWDMELIDAEQAWDITTGGVTALGDTIVVAIMDSGFDVKHLDLVDNLWHNHAEILGDSIDNDGNGYIDDDIGWDYYSESPNIAPGAHGLSVSGIIGASGNNGEGVTGINWQAKLMQFSFSKVSDLIRAYEYAIDQRELYNESNGMEGAFVVATNASFGQPRVFCEEQPAWGAMYDLMGEVGILTGSAADNSPYNVETLGDMPTTCQSDFLIATCNVEEDDFLAQNSAFGAESVDLGAPGNGTVTIKPGDNYGTFGGNSAAAPHITGAIALMYSSPCENVALIAREDPAGMAAFVREAILNGTEINGSLANKTVTGGRLNLKNSLDYIQTQCANEPGNLEIVKVFPNPSTVSLTVEYVSPDFGTYQVEVINPLGQVLWRMPIEVPVFGLREFEVPTAHFPKGIYFLRMQKEKESITTSFMVYH